jgi:hypothetical protein
MTDDCGSFGAMRIRPPRHFVNGIDDRFCAAFILVEPRARREPARYRKILSDGVERVSEVAHFIAAVSIHGEIWLADKCRKTSTNVFNSSCNRLSQGSKTRIAPFRAMECAGIVDSSKMSQMRSAHSRWVEYGDDQREGADWMKMHALVDFAGLEPPSKGRQRSGPRQLDRALYCLEERNALQANLRQSPHHRSV